MSQKITDIDFTGPAAEVYDALLAIYQERHPDNDMDEAAAWAEDMTLKHLR